MWAKSKLEGCIWIQCNRNNDNPGKLDVAPVLMLLICMDWKNHLSPSFSALFCVCAYSCVQLFTTPWIIACQAPLSVEFSRQEYWSGLPFLSPEDLPDPRIEPRSPTMQTYCLPSEPPGKPPAIFWSSKNWRVLTRILLFSFSLHRIQSFCIQWAIKNFYIVLYRELLRSFAHPWICNIN